jgi:Uma2 family endonuclease
MVQLPVKQSIGDLQPQIEQEPESPDRDILGEEWLSDEPELESDFHRDQIDLLLRLMKWIWRDRNDTYCSGNTTVYYDPLQRTNRNFRGPDLYVVLGADPRQRNSWMTWREGGKYPNVVIELLSKSTAKVDRTTKKTLYQDRWKLPNYFWFHPETKEFKGFRLVNGLYVELIANGAGQLWCEELKLFLGLENGFLRLFSEDGQLVLGPDEEAALRAESEMLRAESEMLRAEAEGLRADRAENRAERLAAMLRELGVAVDEEPGLGED